MRRIKPFSLVQLQQRNLRSETGSLCFLNLHSCAWKSLFFTMASFHSLLALLMACLAAIPVHGQEQPAILSSGAPLPCSELQSMDELCSFFSQAAANGVPIGNVSIEGIRFGCNTICADLQSAGSQCGDPGKENAGRDKLRLCE